MTSPSSLPRREVDHYKKCHAGVAAHAQSPAARPGSGCAIERDALLHRCYFAELALEGLVSLLGEIGIKLAQLSGLGDEAFVGASEVVALHLEGLFQRFRADQLLSGRAALLEHFLRIVSDLDSNRLHALGHRTK